MSGLILKVGLALGFSVAMGVAMASPISVAESELKATFKQFNVPVTGEFKEFSGEVQYDPSKPEATSASLSVTTASYDLGDDAYNAEVAGKDWFDAKNHPKASFTLLSVSPKGDAFEAKGELSLRGVKKAVSFPAQVTTENGRHMFRGKATIKRLDFGIGQGEWADTSLVEDPVVIEFKLVTQSK